MKELHEKLRGLENKLGTLTLAEKDLQAELTRAKDSVEEKSQLWK